MFILYALVLVAALGTGFLLGRRSRYSVYKHQLADAENDVRKLRSEALAASSEKAADELRLALLPKHLYAKYAEKLRERHQWLESAIAKTSEPIDSKAEIEAMSRPLRRAESMITAQQNQDSVSRKLPTDRELQMVRTTNVLKDRAKDLQTAMMWRNDLLQTMQAEMEKFSPVSLKAQLAPAIEHIEAYERTVQDGKLSKAARVFSDTVSQLRLQIADLCAQIDNKTIDYSTVDEAIKQLDAAVIAAQFSHAKLDSDAARTAQVHHIARKRFAEKALEQTTYDIHW